MSTAEEKPDASNNVLTITRPAAASRAPSNQSIDILTTIEDVGSTHSLSPTQSTSRNEKSIERETSPFSPFYNPGPTRQSLEKAKSESRQNINVIKNPYDTDLEAASLAPQKTTNTCGGKISSLTSKTREDLECQVWPGQSELKQKRKQMRRAKGEDLMCCGCMARLNKKTKIWVKILIALVIASVAVGVGVGVSRAVGGGVYKDKDNPNAPITR